MYNLSIHFGPNAVVWSFLFKEKEKALQYHIDIGAALGRNSVGQLILEDDFGQKVTVQLASVHGMLLEDMDLGEEARIQRGLIQARGQVKANERARIDPVLRSASNAQGPSVLTPFGGGRFNG